MQSGELPVKFILLIDGLLLVASVAGLILCHYWLPSLMFLVLTIVNLNMLLKDLER